MKLVIDPCKEYHDRFGLKRKPARNVEELRLSARLGLPPRLKRFARLSARHRIDQALVSSVDYAK